MQICERIILRKKSIHCKTKRTHVQSVVTHPKAENCTTYPMESFSISSVRLLTNQHEDATSLSIRSPHLKIYRPFRDKPRPEWDDFSLGRNSEVSIKPRSRCSLWQEVRCCWKIRRQNHLGRWKVQLQLKCGVRSPHVFHLEACVIRYYFLTFVGRNFY